uniref:Coiled-coil domain-containing protein 13-like n=1 Tax=Diabrotica virgifera virgifera TaxID=50390 RepID=A0A6P7GP44_DIAVI
MSEGKSVNTNIVKMPKKIQYTPHREIIPDIPQDIIYPNELNSFLREQLRYHVQKSGLLQQNLNDLEIRYMTSKDNIKKLEEKLNDYEKIYDNAKSSQVATSKIIDLSKKLREKNLEVETLKARCSKTETYAFNLKQQLEDEQLISVKECNAQDTPAVNLPKEENKRQTEKLETLNTKLSESNNLILLLKNELKLAKKIIQQETGENFEALQKLNNLNGWRGRAQHILDLQQKNSELKEKLKTSQGIIMLY